MNAADAMLLKGKNTNAKRIESRIRFNMGVQQTTQVFVQLEVALNWTARSNYYGGFYLLGDDKDCNYELQSKREKGIHAMTLVHHMLAFRNSTLLLSLHSPP
jgi:hypothetical protein